MATKLEVYNVGKRQGRNSKAYNALLKRLLRSYTRYWWNYWFGSRHQWSAFRGFLAQNNTAFASLLFNAELG